MLAVLNLKIDKKQQSKSHCMRIPALLCENKSAGQLFSTFAFAKQIEQYLCFHNSKIKPLAFFFGCTVSSSSKGNNHSPESIYKSIVTFKMLKGI